MKQRIVYIDNLKALAIFTVVIGHVFYFTWNKYNDNVWNNFISVYNMPLFFFLSGMFAKEGLSLKHIGRKAKQLLIPTATIGGTYAYFNNGKRNSGFSGYTAGTKGIGLYSWIWWTYKKNAGMSAWRRSCICIGYRSY